MISTNFKIKTLLLFPKFFSVFNLGDPPPGFDGGGGGDTSGDTGEYIWSQFQDGGEAWGWDLEKLLSEVGKWIYGAFIILCLLFSGLKLITAIGNYFSTPSNNAQLKLQYKNDIKEVVTGFLMLTLGAEVLASLMSVMFPSSQGVTIVGKIKEAISNPAGVFSFLNGKLSGLSNIKSGVKFVFNLTGAVLAIIFAVYTVTYTLKYFKADNDSERVGFKSSAINSVLGLFAVILAASIINRIIEVLFSNGTSIITF